MESIRSKRVLLMFLIISGGQVMNQALALARGSVEVPTVRLKSEKYKG